MDFGLKGAISWFQKKIGTYDKANWEITVEKQELQDFLTEKLSDATIRKELLDIDLIRGSTFSKAKPGYHWTQVTSIGLLKVIFFPLYYKWWRQQTTFGLWLFFLFLYFLQLLALVIYVTNQTHGDFVNISWPEAFMPVMAMVLLGEMFIHVVSTNFTKPISHKIKKKNRSKVTSPAKQRRQRAERSRGRNVERTDRMKKDNSVDCESREESIERVIDDNLHHGGFKQLETEADYSLRRRFRNSDDESSQGSVVTSNHHSPSANTQRKRKLSLQQSSGSISSSDGESDSSSASSISDNEHHPITDTETADVLFPNSEGVINVTQSNTLCQIRGSNDLINISIFDGHSFKKVKLTFLEIGMAVVHKVESKMDKTSDYLTLTFLSAMLIGMLPLLFRIYQYHVMNKDVTLLNAAGQVMNQLQTVDGVLRIYKLLFGSSWKAQLVVFIAMISRITLSFSMFFLLCVAEGVYKVRYMYAKYFGALTSIRRARRNRLPHFRLHKVKNIKAWLSLRSFLKKRGPQRSIDTIVSIAFMFGVLLLVITCFQFLTITGKDEKDHFLSYFFSWEVSAWSLVLGMFLIRFIALGSDINRKYRNTSVLLTEQINLYVQMERNYEKKEELLIANNVLKLASKLLKVC